MSSGHRAEREGGWGRHRKDEKHFWGFLHREAVMSAVNQTVKVCRLHSCGVSSRGLAKSVPEGHKNSTWQNPCEYTFYSRLNVPAAACWIIRSWLCENKTMATWWCSCLVCCYSLVANLWEGSNWFPGPRGNAADPTSEMWKKKGNTSTTSNLWTLTLKMS